MFSGTAWTWLPKVKRSISRAVHSMSGASSLDPIRNVVQDDSSLSEVSVSTSGSVLPELPREVWDLIASWLSSEDLLRLQSLNRAFLAIVMDKKYATVVLDGNGGRRMSESRLRWYIERWSDVYVSSRIRRLVIDTRSLQLPVDQYKRSCLVYEHLPYLNSLTLPYPLGYLYSANILKNSAVSLTNLEIHLNSGVSTRIGIIDPSVSCPNLVFLTLHFDAGSAFCPILDDEQDGYVLATRRLLSLAPNGLRELALHGCIDVCLAQLLLHEYGFPKLAGLHLSDRPNSLVSRIKTSTAVEVCMAHVHSLTSLTLTARSLQAASVLRVLKDRLSLSRLQHLALDPEVLLQYWGDILGLLPHLVGLHSLDVVGCESPPSRYHGSGWEIERAKVFLRSLSTSRRLRSISFPVDTLNPDLLFFITSTFPDINDVALYGIQIISNRPGTSALGASRGLWWLLRHTETSRISIRFTGVAHRLVGLQRTVPEENAEAHISLLRSVCEAFAGSVDLEHFQYHNDTPKSWQLCGLASILASGGAGIPKEQDPE